MIIPIKQWDFGVFNHLQAEHAQYRICRVEPPAVVASLPDQEDFVSKVERLVHHCRDIHGGFQHGNHVYFCSDCEAELREWVAHLRQIRER